MLTLEYFNDFVKEINESNSRLHKQAVLEKYAEDLIIHKYLLIAFDPYKVYGISTKKLNKEIEKNPAIVFHPSIFNLFEYLETHNTGTTEDIIRCHRYLELVEKDMPECVDLLKALICKDLSIGVDAKTINKVIPGLIPTFDVQLANKYFDKPQFVEGKTFAATTKIDGGRIIALKENGQVSFYTRAGQKYEGLVDLEDEMMVFIPDNTCLDGEITLQVRGNLSSKEAYKETMKIVRTKDKEKHGVKMQVFDWMPVEDFKKQQCSIPYKQRRNKLENIFGDDYHNYMFFELLPLLYVGDDTSVIPQLLDEQIADGEEGVMINIYDAPYEFKRTNNLLKCKKFQSCDLRVVGFEEGTGKYVGMLGALICEYKDGTVKVGSGLTDELRKEIWKDTSKYENIIIEVSYFEETKDSTGKESLRFPTFKDFRPDKTEPNY